MTTRYKILFTVDLLHDYFASKQCRDVEVIPAAPTAALLRGRQMIFKMVGNKIVVLVKVHMPPSPDADKPFVDIDPRDKYIFYLVPSTPAFNIITNLSEERLRTRNRYYFTNLYQNKLDGERSLTQKIVAVPGVANYRPGDFTADGGGTVYECVAATNQTNNPPNAAFWQSRASEQYASQLDTLPLRRTVETFDVTPPAKHFDIKAFALDLGTNLYTREIILNQPTFDSDVDTTTVQVNLAGLVPGRYKLTINAATFDVFVDDTAAFNNVLGMIEIFSHLGNGTDFGFLSATGQVKDDGANWLRYKIHFANRMAYWKYNTPKHGVTAIDASPAYTFTPTPAGPAIDYFTSSKPIPLLEQPWKFKVNVQVLSATEDPLAPNPDPNITGMLSRPADDYFCTMNLNY